MDNGAHLDHAGTNGKRRRRLSLTEHPNCIETRRATLHRHDTVAGVVAGKMVVAVLANKLEALDLAE